MSISRSQLGQMRTCGDMEDAEDETTLFFFLIGEIVVPTLSFLAPPAGSPNMFTTALSEITVWCKTGIVTAALQTGHLPVLPALDSFAVK